MPRKSTLAIVALLGMLLAVGYAEAAERGASTRTPSVRAVAATTAQTPATGSLSLSKILNARFLSTWKMLADLADAQSNPPVFGTDGLSDGPDPIDSSGQAGGGSGSETDGEKGDNSGNTGGEDAGDNGASFDSN